MRTEYNQHEKEMRKIENKMEEKKQLEEYLKAEGKIFGDLDKQLNALSNKHDFKISLHAIIDLKDRKGFVKNGRTRDWYYYLDNWDE